MSRSNANKLLQELYAKMAVKWSGVKTDFTANEAYGICRKIVKEVDEDDNLFNSKNESDKNVVGNV